ncbi:MAG: ABC transporter substrate-binding protein [Bacteroidales bacterium]
MLFRVKIFLDFLTLVIMVHISTGIGLSQTPVNSAPTIKIGLLFQDSSCRSALNGAELAVRLANLKGGLNGRTFQLVSRSMEGPWGTGSRQAVDLIFKEKVWALLGSHDGRNAHLVEQAATKSQVVLLSSWSGDPTLSQAFVPWFYNCVPNDFQQATALINEIYAIRKIRKPVIICDNEYDSQQAFNNFLKKARLEGNPEPVQFNYDTYNHDRNHLVNQIENTGTDCVILFCGPSSSLEIFRQIRQMKMHIPVFGSLHLLNEDVLSINELREYDNDLLIPSGTWPVRDMAAFVSEFKKTYGNDPGMVAAYAFDGMNLLIEAIKKSESSDRERIQKALSGIKYTGVTGPVKFDEKGNRTGAFNPRSVINGVPAAAKTD